MSNGFIQSENSFYPSTGQMASQWHSGRKTIGGVTIDGQRLDYGYDAWGNLVEHSLAELTSTNTHYGITETLNYDRLHRLTATSRTVNQGNIQTGGTIAPKSYTYDKLGNLLQKSDFTRAQNSLYGASGNAGPNAISTAYLKSNNGTDNINYIYDAKGNRIRDVLNALDVATYKYDANNLLISSSSSIVPNANQSHMQFRYGADNQRYYKNDGNEITIYGGKEYEQIFSLSGQVKETKFYITDYLTLTRKPSGDSYHYLQKDRLGSTTQVLDASGNRIHARSYDAFGKPRNGDWSDMDTTLFTAKLDLDAGGSDVDISKRGFTDHEHLDDLQLIHMNGRMYDYNNGRFLSVDPFIAGTGSQAINAYTYIGNNPMSGIDPSGYSACERKPVNECSKGGKDGLKKEDRRRKSKGWQSVSTTNGLKNPENWGSGRNKNVSDTESQSSSSNTNEQTSRGKNNRQFLSKKKEALENCQSQNLTSCGGVSIHGNSGLPKGISKDDVANEALKDNVSVDGNGSVSIKLKIYKKGNKRTASQSLREIRNEWGKAGVNVEFDSASSEADADIIVIGAGFDDFVKACLAVDCESAASLDGVGLFKGKLLYVNNYATPGKKTATHEFGHKLGLRHRTTGIMGYPNQTDPNSGTRVLDSDVERLRGLYE